MAGSRAIRAGSHDDGEKQGKERQRAPGGLPPLGELAAMAGNRAVARLIESRTDQARVRSTAASVHPVAPGVVQRQDVGEAIGGEASDSSSADLTHPLYRIRIVGHASPRWRAPGQQTPDQRNMALSRERALAVESAVRSLFASGIGGAPVDFEVMSVESDGDTASLAVDWLGSSQTSAEGGRDADANAPEMRRVDVIVEVVESTTVWGGSSQVVEMDAATTEWAIKVDFAVTAGEVVGAAYGVGQLKNMRTGQTLDGRWGGAGIGAGVELPIPAVSPNPSWASFRTNRPVTFSDFDGAWVRFSNFDIGIGVAGYSWAYLTFMGLMDGPVDVDSFVMNQWGLGGTVTAGPWEFWGAIPPPPTEVREVPVAYETAVGSCFGHRLLFETQESALSSEHLDGLQAFVGALP